MGSEPFVAVGPTEPRSWPVCVGLATTDAFCTQSVGQQLASALFQAARLLAGGAVFDQTFAQDGPLRHADGGIHRHWRSLRHVFDRVPGFERVFWCAWAGRWRR